MAEAEAAERSVLQRKLRAAAPEPALAAMTPGKAMRLAVARAGDAALGCPVALTDLSEGRGLPDELVAGLPDPALVLRLKGPGAVSGLAVLCPQAVGAMIEAQTLGRVLAAPAADRRPTRTDATLVGEFVDLVAAGCAALMGEAAGAPPLGGFVCAEPVADLRSGAMALRDADHLHYALSLDFAGGAKTGALHLLVPEAGETAAAAPGPDAWQGRFCAAVLASPARLEAVLCRQRLPLRQVTGLAVGDVLELAASLEKVALTGTDGKTVITARLGRSGASRALRLMLDEPAPARVGQASGTG